jgi:vesicle coat complex subunit
MSDVTPGTKKGEMKEIADQLAQPSLATKKAAMKRIIGAMTYGVDVSPLFTEIIKNMETPNMELKKLIYLYVINYAKTHPDLIIMAINSFRKDALDKNNPLLRALAVRTMGCIRVSQITEYLVDPLKAALQDEDSYVKKTGVICLVKLYESNPELMDSLRTLPMLENLLTDGNPMVVSNVVAAYGQISEIKGVNLLTINHQLAHKLLSAMNEATEWGQTFILDAFVHYQPRDHNDIEEI